jgi:hypothetical protein
MQIKTKWIALILVGMAMGAGMCRAAQNDDEDMVSAVSFVVLKDDNGKPLRNAAVVIHPVNHKGKQERNGIELKTDPDGNASFDSVPYGKMRIQVLAQGFQTYGEDFNIDQPSMKITVKMKRPTGQYSIYETHPKSTDGSGETAPDSSQGTKP